MDRSGGGVRRPVLPSEAEEEQAGREGLNGIGAPGDHIGGGVLRAGRDHAPLERVGDEGVGGSELSVN